MTPKLHRMSPPGSLCTLEAIRDVVKRTAARRFVDVGCGTGEVSKLLCSMGLTGLGIDFSPGAIEACRRTLQAELAESRYALIEDDVTALEPPRPRADLGISVMVMEHVHDDVGFVRTLSRFVRPSGHLVLCVPGRKDRWSLEDDTVGHLRRYDRNDLRRVLEAGGLDHVEILSVGVPVANILLPFGTRLIGRSREVDKLGQSPQAQTRASACREIPWKTVFPRWVKPVLNRYTLWPLFPLQRLFYRTGLGVILLGLGRVTTLDQGDVL